jgi:hypothetical protein
MNDENEKMEKALIDVRKAFRLLQVYQKAIFSLVGKIEANLGLIFDSWRPKYFRKPCKRSKKPYERYAWDFLPGYDTCFLFEVRNSVVNENWVLEVQVSADSSNYLEVNGQPDPREFEAPENCKPFIQFSGFKLIEFKASSSNTVIAEYWECDYPENEGKLEEVTESLVGIKFREDLNNFIDQDSYERTLKSVQSKFVEIGFNFPRAFHQFD